MPSPFWHTRVPVGTACIYPSHETFCSSRFPIEIIDYDYFPRRLPRENKSAKWNPRGTFPAGINWERCDLRPKRRIEFYRIWKSCHPNVITSNTKTYPSFDLLKSEEKSSFILFSVVHPNDLIKIRQIFWKIIFCLRDKISEGFSPRLRIFWLV